jgi:hypothetical protein
MRATKHYYIVVECDGIAPSLYSDYRHSTSRYRSLRTLVRYHLDAYMAQVYDSLVAAMDVRDYVVKVYDISVIGSPLVYSARI